MRRWENEGSTFTIYSPNTTNEWPKLWTINLSGWSFNLKKDESWIFYDNSFKINDNKVKFLTWLPSEETLDSLEKSVTSLQQPESKAPKQPEKPTENTIYSVEKWDTFWKIVKEYYNNKEQPLSNNDIANIINRLVIINKARNKRFNKRYEYLSKGKETPFWDEILWNLLRPWDELELPSEIWVVIKDWNPTKTFKKVK
jgi:LysM repeat protein